MTRLIDAEVLKKSLQNFFQGLVIKNHENIDEDIFYYIDNAPTVEPICPYLSDNEVKQPCLQSPCERPHGEWK